MHRQHHYLIYLQIAALSAMVVISFGSQGLQFVAQYAPLLITSILLIVSLRLCVRIVQLVDPQYKQRRAGHMHGSMLPRLVFEPNY